MYIDRLNKPHAYITYILVFESDRIYNILDYLYCSKQGYCDVIKTMIESRGSVTHAILNLIMTLNGYV